MRLRDSNYRHSADGSMPYSDSYVQQHSAPPSEHCNYNPGHPSDHTLLSGPYSDLPPYGYPNNPNQCYMTPNTGQYNCMYDNHYGNPYYPTLGHSSRLYPSPDCLFAHGASENDTFSDSSDSIDDHISRSSSAEFLQYNLPTDPPPARGKKRKRRRYKTTANSKLNETIVLQLPSQPPKSIPDAVCMYIDYLIAENEAKTDISTTEPINRNLFVPFEEEEYAKEVLNKEVSFPTPKFQEWLRLYNFEVQVCHNQGTSNKRKVPPAEPPFSQQAPQPVLPPISTFTSSLPNLPQPTPEIQAQTHQIQDEETAAAAAILGNLTETMTTQALTSNQNQQYQSRTTNQTHKPLIAANQTLYSSEMPKSAASRTNFRQNSPPLAVPLPTNNVIPATTQAPSPVNKNPVPFGGIPQAHYEPLSTIDLSSLSPDTFTVGHKMSVNKPTANVPLFEASDVRRSNFQPQANLVSELGNHRQVSNKQNLTTTMDLHRKVIIPTNVHKTSHTQVVVNPNIICKPATSSCLYMNPLPARPKMPIQRMPNTTNMTIPLMQNMGSTVVPVTCFNKQLQPIPMQPKRVQPTVDVSDSGTHITIIDVKAGEPNKVSDRESNSTKQMSHHKHTERQTSQDNRILDNSTNEGTDTETDERRKSLRRRSNIDYTE